MSKHELPPSLDAVQARVLACLVEKAALTPELYPLTLNAVVAACNQKTSRDPVLNLEPGVVGHALRQLEDQGLARVVHGARALRYEHRFDQVYTLTPQQTGLLCLMLLRGPQTQSELFARTDRIARFTSLDEIHETLDRLCARQPPLAYRLGRSPGQREDRYTHTLCGEPEPDRPRHEATEPRTSTEHDSLLAQLRSLEARVAALEERLRS